jgi:AcrR family transcriptional regulator
VVAVDYRSHAKREELRVEERAVPNTTSRRSPKAPDADPSERSQDGQHERILDAAAQAFMLRGFAATTIDQIAENVGATKGLVYHYFRSKTELFLDVLSEAMRRTAGVVSHVSGPGDPEARLRRMIVEHAEAMIVDLPLHRVMVQGVEQYHRVPMTDVDRKRLEDILRWRREYEAAYVRVVEEGIAQGSFRDANAKVAVKMLLGALNWITIWYRPDHTASSPAEIVESAADFLMAGLLNHRLDSDPRPGQGASATARIPKS